MVTAEYFLVFGFCSVVGFCPIPQTVLRRRKDEPAHVFPLQAYLIVAAAGSVAIQKDWPVKNGKPAVIGSGRRNQDWPPPSVPISLRHFQ
jgi:hypothetical protein